MAALPASVMVSTMSLGPAPAPAVKTPSMSVTVGASLGKMVRMKRSDPLATGQMPAGFHEGIIPMESTVKSCSAVVIPPPVDPRSAEWHCRFRRARYEATLALTKLMPMALAFW
jgi:hypothetical protein